MEPASLLSTRREFLHLAGGALALTLGSPRLARADKSAEPLNVLLFTADDLHYRSLGCFDGAPKDLTPNMDAFAEKGMRFHRAHVNAAICMPSRIVLATGLYGHNSGAMGFVNAREGTPNAIDIFQKAGYLAGILGKVPHSTPCRSNKWDYSFDQPQLGNGRDPELYFQRCADFFARCKREKKPFYIMVNSHDPHRPFHVPGKPIPGAKEPSRVYKPADVTVPGFLPDLPGVREEFCTYLNSARRCDDTFGRVMQALKESGFEDRTLVMFLSDNGISMPFAKANCYLASTRTPWIVRWPGVVKAGACDREHFISGVDYLPTVLEAVGIPAPKRLDGRSFLPLLKGQPQDGRDAVFTQIDRLSSGSAFPMRCVQTERYGYIFNAWSDGTTTYSNANEGMTMRAMNEAAKTGAAIAERVRMFRNRALEEFYDLREDPDCLKNLINEPKLRKERDALVATLRAWMAETGDPLLKAFDSRQDEAARKKAMRGIFDAKPKATAGE